ncbi:MAG: response regulator [Rhodocyclaceae bacterium]|nr:response regulator [Rhodocyclaceae bacterium]
MTDMQKILVTDDDAFMRVMIAEAIGDRYEIVEAASGDECLALAASEKPDAILLDVEMVGLDGYETCRRLKADFELDGIPVIFVSSHDQIEARLRGYEAGAEDYIVKPFAAQEIAAKIAALLGKVSQTAQLKQMASYASQTAMTAMSSMSEIGSLLQSLQAFNNCVDFQALLDATLGGLRAYGLEGAVQIRTQGATLTSATHGEASPLEASVISHMAGMERIVQYRNRLSITYPSVSLLVSNMPLEDADRCGRLRDHLAVLVESAEVRSNTLIADARSRERGERIAAAVKRITDTLAEIDDDQRHSRVNTTAAIQELTASLERAWVKLALTEQQEQFIANVASDGVARVQDAQLAEAGQQDKMSKVVRELQSLLTI